MQLQRAPVDEGPESHRHHRRLSGSACSRQGIEGIEAAVRRATTRCLDRFISRGRAELVGDLFPEVPARVILSFPGVPDDEATFRKWIGGKPLIEGWWRLDPVDQVRMPRAVGWRWTFTKPW